MPHGVLYLDEIDSTSGLIRGRFAVMLRSVNRTPAETLSVNAAFSGRLDMMREWPVDRTPWASWIDRDCERIRGPIVAPLTTALSAGGP